MDERMRGREQQRGRDIYDVKVMRVVKNHMKGEKNTRETGRCCNNEKRYKR